MAWKGGRSFELEMDAGPASPAVVVKPDQGSDTVDPPLEYQLNVTDVVRGWLAGSSANEGLAIAPVRDRSVDKGYITRFQIYASEHTRPEFTPKLTLQVRP